MAGTITVFIKNRVVEVFADRSESCFMIWDAEDLFGGPCSFLLSKRSPLGWEAVAQGEVGNSNKPRACVSPASLAHADPADGFTSQPAFRAEASGHGLVHPRTPAKA